jgi:hypothetical protein
MGLNPLRPYEVMQWVGSSKKFTEKLHLFITKTLNDIFERIFVIEFSSGI